jgi:hypothetical protein
LVPVYRRRIVINLLDIRIFVDVEMKNESGWEGKGDIDEGNCEGETDCREK